MKIKRFVASDIRKAMKMVKDELGADAVIMSNRSVEDGVEIVAARDFDEQAIHNDLQQLEQKQPKPSPQQVKLSTFEDDEKPLHVISSSRKQGNEEVRRENPIRKNMDQYLGYAEKIQVANQRQKKTATTSTNKKTTPARPRKATPNTQPVTQVQAPVVNLEPLLKDMKLEMRKEMAGLKSMLEQRFDEVVVPPAAPQQTTYSVLKQRLHEMGFDGAVLQRICNRLGSHQDVQRAFDKACDMLVDDLPMLADDLLYQGGIAALVGPTGVGKTTTLAKIAAQFILRHGAEQVALISMDNFRIGGQEQLKIYGRILDVPVKVAKNTQQLNVLLDEFSDKRLVLIDTAGMGQRDMRLAEQINSLPFKQYQVKTYLVLSAATQGRSISETIQAFNGCYPQAAILTKLDETVAPGGALSALFNHKLPVAFVTDGQQVPEDFHDPDAQALLQHCIAGIAEENSYTNQETGEDWVAGAYA